MVPYICLLFLFNASCVLSQYTTIWYDAMEENNGLRWHVSGYITYGVDSTLCVSGLCTLTYRDPKNDYTTWIRRSTSVSSYQSLRIQYSVGVSSLESTDECRVYYSLTSDIASRELIQSHTTPDTASHLYPNNVVILPDTSSANTVYIWLETWGPNSGNMNDFCYWDEVSLEGILTAAPTPLPTENSTTNPTKTPTSDPTQNPTANPTKLTKMPSPAPTKIPTANPSTLHTTILPTVLPTKTPIEKPTTSPGNILYAHIAPSDAPTEAESEVNAKQVTTAYIVKIDVCSSSIEDECDFDEDEIVNNVKDTYAGFVVIISDVETYDDTVVMELSIKTDHDKILETEPMEEQIESNLVETYSSAEVEVKRKQLDDEDDLAADHINYEDFVIPIVVVVCVVILFCVCRCLWLWNEQKQKSNALQREVAQGYGDEDIDQTVNAVAAGPIDPDQQTEERQEELSKNVRKSAQNNVNISESVKNRKRGTILKRTAEGVRDNDDEIEDDDDSEKLYAKNVEMETTTTDITPNTTTTGGAPRDTEHNVSNVTRLPPRNMEQDMKGNEEEGDHHKSDDNPSEENGDNDLYETADTKGNETQGATDSV